MSKGNQVLRSCKEENLWSDYQCACILVHVSAQHKQRAACADRTCHCSPGSQRCHHCCWCHCRPLARKKELKWKGRGWRPWWGWGPERAKVICKSAAPACLQLESSNFVAYMCMTEPYKSPVAASLLVSLQA